MPPSIFQLRDDLRRAMKAAAQVEKDMPRIAGNECVKIIKNNFKLQGYATGSSVKAWPKRASKTNKAYDSRGAYKGSVYNSSNPLELQTRNLYNSIKFKALSKSVVIGVDILLIPYAQIQNEGGRGIPARQYMPHPDKGPNRLMKKAIADKAKKEFDRSFNNFRT